MHHDVATSSLLQARCPVVSEAAATIGDPQVRNRGTLGGSIAHADPSADMPAVVLAQNAEIHHKGPGGWRVVKAADILKDLFTGDKAALVKRIGNLAPDRLRPILDGVRLLTEPRDVD